MTERYNVMMGWVNSSVNFSDTQECKIESKVLDFQVYSIYKSVLEDTIQETGGALSAHLYVRGLANNRDISQFSKEIDLCTTKECADAVKLKMDKLFDDIKYSDVASFKNTIDELTKPLFNLRCNCDYQYRVVALEPEIKNLFQKK